MMSFYRKILPLFLLLIPAASLAQQVTKVRGKVTDAETGEPIPIASVTFPGTAVGMTTDFEGNYHLEIRGEVSEIICVHVSYVQQSKPVQAGQFNTVDFVMKPAEQAIEAVVVRPGPNPAHPLLRKIRENKKWNNPAEKESYSYTTYTKMKLEISNVKTEFKNKRVQKNLGFVFQYVDTSAVTGKAYLPVLISEATADYYYRKNPKLSREILKASRISGIENNTFAQFTGQLYVNVNPYENYINIFEVNFVSPLNDQGLMYYKYYLVDSLLVGGRQTYVWIYRLN